jgi:sugar phosphate isomerase/epimerase
VTKEAAVHERLSVHTVAFFGTSLTELDTHWQALGLRRLSLIDSQLFDPVLPQLIDSRGYAVEAVYHLFASGRLSTESTDVRAARDNLSRVIEASAAVRARTVYMLTGGRGPLTWEQAAEQFCTTIAPCLDEAEQAGLALAIENASGLYADIHLTHTLRDTITLAEMAGLGICIDLFHCWTEADVATLVQRALPRTQLIQLSDYVLGDRALPARAVPGDGAIPIEPFVAQVLRGGYPHGFDLELIGPRIEHEGRFQAVRRACTAVTAILHRLGT